MDTWGLLMLARARAFQPAITALLMGRLLFEHYASGSAVAEPVNAQQAVPEGLHHHEADFTDTYCHNRGGVLSRSIYHGTWSKWRLLNGSVTFLFKVYGLIVFIIRSQRSCGDIRGDTGGGCQVAFTASLFLPLPERGKSIVLIIPAPSSLLRRV